MSINVVPAETFTIDRGATYHWFCPNTAAVLQLYDFDFEFFKTKWGTFGVALVEASRRAHVILAECNEHDPIVLGVQKDLGL